MIGVTDPCTSIAVTDFGQRKPDHSTGAVHGDMDMRKSQPHNALVTPLVQTATYTFTDTADLCSFMESKMWDMCMVTPSTPIEDIISLLGSRKHIWVVRNMKNNRLLGLITERDMVEIIAPRKLSPYKFTISTSTLRSLLFGGIETAEDMMTTDLVTARPEDTMGKALQKMKRHHLKRLPVVKAGRIVGELTMELAATGAL